MTNLKFKILPTMEVNRSGHRVIINKSDYNPSIHKIWTEEDEKDKELEKKPVVLKKPTNKRKG